MPEPRAGSRSRDAGYSLAELLVVMSIFGIISAVVLTVLVTVQRQARDKSGRSEQVRQARLGRSQIDRQVRSGTVVVDPARAGELPRSLRVYTQTDGVRRCVQWQVVDRTLRYRSWDPNWGAGGTVDAWQVVARTLLADAGQPAANFERVTAAGGSQAQSVRVRLYLQAQESGGRPVEVTTVLSGRNTVYGYPANVCSPTPPA